MTQTSSLDVGLTSRNKEEYADYTEFQALEKAQRAEFGYRPLVYISSRYSGDTEVNLELTRRNYAHAEEAKKIYPAPHLLFRCS